MDQSGWLESVVDATTDGLWSLTARTMASVASPMPFSRSVSPMSRYISSRPIFAGSAKENSCR